MSKAGDDFVDQLFKDMLDEDEKQIAKPGGSQVGSQVYEGNRNNYANREGHIAGMKRDPQRKEEIKQEVIAAGLPEVEAEYTVERAYEEGSVKHDPSKVKHKNTEYILPQPGDSKVILKEKGTQDQSKRLPEVARYLGTRQQVTLVAGLGGVGKTTLLLYAAHCVATGKDFMGSKVQQGRAIIITNEDKSVIKEMMSELPNSDYIHIHDGSAETIGHLLAVEAKDGVAMIIIDPAMVAHRWFGVRDWSENSSNPWGDFIDGALKPLARKTNALIVLLHHTRKRPTQGGVDARGFIRGSGGIVDMVDNAGVLLADNNDRTFELVKRRGGRKQVKIKIGLTLKEITQTHDTGETETFHAVTGGRLLETGLPLDELINFGGSKPPDGEELLKQICQRMYASREKYTTQLGYLPKGDIMRLFSSGQRDGLRQTLSNLLFSNSSSWDDNRLFNYRKKGKSHTYNLRSGPEGPCPEGQIQDITKHHTE